MKKQTARYIVYTVVTLLVVVCCFAVYKYFTDKNSAGKGDGREIVFECIPGDIKKITIENSSGKYSMIKEEKWFIDELRGKELVEDSIIANVNTMSRIRGKAFENESIKLNFDLKATISTDKKDFRFEFAQDDDNYYLKTEKGDIYTVSQIWHTVVERDMNFYRDNSLNDIKSLTEGGENRFVSYNYKPSPKQTNLREITVRVKNSNEIQHYNTNSPYMLEKPYLRSIDKDVFESKVLSSIPNIRIDKFISEDTENYAPYGLDKESRGELTVRYDDKVFKLFIGSDAESGTVYAALDGKNAVFTVMKGWIEFINSESFEFIEKTLYTYNSDYITRAEVTFKDKKITLRSSGGKFYIDDKPVSDETFNSFKEEIIKLQISSLANKADGEELMLIKLFGKDYKTVKFALYKTEDGRFMASENDTLYYYINENQVKEFENYFTELQKALI